MKTDQKSTTNSLETSEKIENSKKKKKTNNDNPWVINQTGILKLKNKIIKIKILVDGFNARIEMA